MPEDVAAGAHELEREIARSRGMSEDDRWQLRADGTRFWASGVMYAIHDGDALVAFMKILRNRTESKEQLEAWRNRVEHLAGEARERERLVAGLAHELRNPLAALANATEIVRLQAKELPAVQSAVAVLDRQIAFLKRTVGDLLDVVRARTGKLQLLPARVDLRTIVREAVEEVGDEMARRRHQLETLQPHGPVWADVDAMRIRQVLVNLLVNAAKYTPPGGRVWVQLTKEGGDAVFRVIDTGIGIPAEMSGRIFDMFTQVDEARSEGGLGIGLALVREIASLHGGTVSGDTSSTMPGSTFVVRLPMPREG